jgi:hypothetical protein
MIYAQNFCKGFFVLGIAMESQWSRSLTVGFVLGFFFFFFLGIDARGGRSGSRWLWWHGVAVELERRSDMVGGFC